MLSACSTPFGLPMTIHDRHFSSDLSPKLAAIYFYREQKFAHIRGMYITANGKRIGAMNNGTYFVYLVSPGTYVFSIEDWLGDDPSRKINVKAGESYYIRGKFEIGVWDVQPRIMIANSTEGESVIRNLKYATLK